MLEVLGHQATATSRPQPPTAKHAPSEGFEVQSIAHFLAMARAHDCPEPSILTCGCDRIDVSTWPPTLALVESVRRAMHGLERQGLVESYRLFCPGRWDTRSEWVTLWRLVSVGSDEIGIKHLGGAA